MADNEDRLLSDGNSSLQDYCVRCPRCRVNWAQTLNVIVADDYYALVMGGWGECKSCSFKLELGVILVPGFGSNGDICIIVIDTGDECGEFGVAGVVIVIIGKGADIYSLYSY